MRPFRKTFNLLIVICAALMMLAIFSPIGCSKKEQKGNVIKIGLCGPFSGQAANWGEQFKKGIELAFSEVDETDMNHIKLFYEDSEADPRKAVLAIQKLISVDKVKIIIGPLRNYLKTLSFADKPSVDLN